jgi:hypothetical protein
MSDGAAAQVALSIRCQLLEIILIVDHQPIGLGETPL